MKRLVWSPEASADLVRLRAFLRPKNPQAARRAIVAIRAGVKKLEKFPQIGRPLHDSGPGIRERVIAFGSGGYVVRYQIRDLAILIVAIRHGREDDFKN